MSAKNLVILIGNIGKDPEIQTFEGGRKKAQFSMATSEKYKDKSGNYQTKTDWHNIESWRSVDFIEKYMKKGHTIIVTGKLRTTSWEGEGGVKKYKTFVEATNIEFSIGNAKQDDSAKTSNPPAAKKTTVEEFSSEEDDLPF